MMVWKMYGVVRQHQEKYPNILDLMICYSDLRIKKTFDDNPILWALVSIVARGMWFLFS